MIETIVAKHRNGSLDTVKLRFIGKYTKVTDYVTAPTSPSPRMPYRDDAPEKDDLPF